MRIITNTSIQGFLPNTKWKLYSKPSHDEVVFFNDFDDPITAQNIVAIYASDYGFDIKPNLFVLLNQNLMYCKPPILKVFTPDPAISTYRNYRNSFSPENSPQHPTWRIWSHKKTGTEMLRVNLTYLAS